MYQRFFLAEGNMKVAPQNDESRRGVCSRVYDFFGEAVPEGYSVSCGYLSESELTPMFQRVD
jgi:hypothetical protein